MDVNAQTFVVVDGTVPFGEGQRHKHHFPQWLLPSLDDPFCISGVSKGTALPAQRSSLTKESQCSNMKDQI